MRERSKRQSLGISNSGFDRFPGADQSHFDPLLSPSFTQAQQQAPPTPLGQKPLSLADMVDLTNPPEPDTLIDYLTPPSPTTFQNYPPLQNNGPFSGTSNNGNTAQQSFHNSFAPPQQTAFSNINPTVTSVNPPISTNPVSPNINPTSFPNTSPGFADQNSNFVTPPTNFVTPQSREISNSFNSFSSSNDQQGTNSNSQSSAPAPQGKWDLGFDASDILNPPLYESPSNPSPTAGDYETLFPRRPAISSSASNNAPVLALHPSHSQFTIHGSLRANEQGQSIIWGTFKPAPFANLPPVAPTADFSRPAPSNEHLRYSPPPQQPDNYTPFSDSYLPQGTATDSFIPHPDETFSSSFRRRQSQNEESDDETSYDKPPPAQVKGPVYSFVKTFKNGSFKWGVRQGALNNR